MFLKHILLKFNIKKVKIKDHYQGSFLVVNLQLSRYYINHNTGQGLHLIMYNCTCIWKYKRIQIFQLNWNEWKIHFDCLSIAIFQFAYYNVFEKNVFSEIYGHLYFEMQLKLLKIPNSRFNVLLWVSKDQWDLFHINYFVYLETGHIFVWNHSKL